MLLTDFLPIAHWIESWYYRGWVPHIIGRWIVNELDKWYNDWDVVPEE